MFFKTKDMSHYVVQGTISKKIKENIYFIMINDLCPKTSNIAICSIC